MRLQRHQKCSRNHTRGKVGQFVSNQSFKLLSGFRRLVRQCVTDGLQITQEIGLRTHDVLEWPPGLEEAFRSVHHSVCGGPVSVFSIRSEQLNRVLAVCRVGMPDWRISIRRFLSEQIQDECLFKKSFPRQERPHKGKFDNLREMLFLKSCSVKMLEMAMPDACTRGKLNCPFKLFHAPVEQRA